MKTCLITGGAGFLGSKYCDFFLKNRYRVLCVDNNLIKLNKLKKKFKKNFFIYQCDISDNNEVENLFKLTKNYFVDVLINNAAIDAVPFSNLSSKSRFPTLENWDREINVSIKGSFLMIKFFGENMRSKKKGSIINIGSDLSVIAPNQKIYEKSYKNYIKPVTYSVIKHAMLGLTKYFSSLYASCGVRVNMVSPGSIKNKQKLNFINELKKNIPMNRLGYPQDIFGVLKMLASDESLYITGQNIIIDGGRTVI